MDSVDCVQYPGRVRVIPLFDEEGRSLVSISTTLRLDVDADLASLSLPEVQLVTSKNRCAGCVWNGNVDFKNGAMSCTGQIPGIVLQSDYGPVISQRASLTFATPTDERAFIGDLTGSRPEDYSYDIPDTLGCGVPQTASVQRGTLFSDILPALLL
jgi:hypothetical protein